METEKICLDENLRTALVLNVGNDNEANYNSIIFYFKTRYTLRDSKIVLLTTGKYVKEKKIDHFNKVIEDSIPDFESNGNGIDEIVIDAGSVDDIKEKLKEYFDNNAFMNVCVNVTNGTNVLSIAEYDFFKENEKFYKWDWLNIFYHFYEGKRPQRLVQVYSQHKYRHSDVDTAERSVVNFFDGFGNTIVEKGMCVADEGTVIKNMKIFLNPKNAKLINDFNEMRNSFFKPVRNNKEEFLKSLVIDLETETYSSNATAGYISYVCSGFNSQKAKEFVIKLGLPAKLSFDQVCFIANGWFEELAYYLVKRKYDLSQGMCEINVKFKNVKTELKNELDVVFVDNKNRLNIIECKNTTKTDVLKEAINKKNTIVNNFGVNTFFQLWTTGERKELDFLTLKRAKENNIKVIFREKIEAMIKDFYS